MKAELQAIADAMDKTTGNGRDKTLAVELAEAYVTANPGEYTGYEEKTLPDLVAAVDVFRAAGFEDELWRTKAWILHRFEFQNIGGEVTPQVRISAAPKADPTRKSK